jgi:hypothetical protein
MYCEAIREPENGKSRNRPKGDTVKAYGALRLEPNGAIIPTSGSKGTLPNNFIP